MRTIRYEHEFDSTLKRIQPDFERADASLVGVEWVLSRDPRFGICVDESSQLWCMVLNEEFIERHVIAYSFDDSKVYMLAIGVIRE